MRSITSRLVIGTSVFIAIFIILLAFSISYSVHKRAESARFDALKGIVYGVLGAVDIDDNAQFSIDSASLPDEQLNNFNASLFAEVIGNDRRQLWKSNSTIHPLPETEIRPINDWQFEKVEADNGVELLRVQYVIAWELANGEELPFIVHVAENVEDLTSQLRRFDRVLWLALLGVAPILPLVQFIMLRLSLKPLRDIGQEVDDIESGHRDALSESVPEELRPLTSGLNALLSAERERHAQYRNLLGDLSHNLKTPLSVLQNIADSDGDNAQTIVQQTELMKSTLEQYALITETPEQALLTISDDGPGWPDGNLQDFMQRGVRADTRTHGQGIGLAVSDQIMRAYGGKLELSRGQHGGATVNLHFMNGMESTTHQLRDKQ